MDKGNRQSRIESINALAELERIGWPVTPTGGTEVKTRCPVHKDNTPSVQFNVENNLWNCKACKATGDIVTFLAHALGVERATVLVDLGTRYNLEAVKVIDPKNVDKFHEGIWDAGPLLQALYARGVNDAMLREARIGFWDTRITIPIYDAERRVVNIRRYLPGAPGHEKFRNTKGYGKPHLYQVEHLAGKDTVWICGGEIKALVAGWHLRKDKIACVAASAGEGIWNVKWTSLLEGKHVYICMDVDGAGRKAARDIGNAVYRAAASVHIIDLPLDLKKHPKGDLNDYIGTEGAGRDELIALMPDAREFAPMLVGASGELAEGKVKETTLERSIDPENVGRRILFEAVCVAMDDTPFLVPKSVQAVCDRNQQGCTFCPLYNMEQDPDSGGVEVVIPPYSPGILQMVNAPLNAQAEAIQTAISVPGCKSITFRVRSHYKVHDIRLSPQLKVGSGRTVNVVQPALILDKDLEMNAPYNLTGVVYPHPKNQQAIILIEGAEEAVDNLVSYAPTRAELADLMVFRPEEWTTESLSAKLSVLYSDLAANVTRIFGRDEIHTLIDLTFHSVIAFQFDRRLVTGWVNSLILGDSSQGKSETAIRLMEHYGLGERFVMKNATVAGLLGGLAQLGGRWFVSWGVIPTHDRRLVVLDEVKGADTDVLAKLTDMRSSGIAELGKIERRRAHARTRLIFISNPRGRRTLGTYNFGIEAIRDLIGNLEDIRRFDIACIAASSQIAAEFIVEVKRNRPEYPHVFTSDLCRRLLLWGWTRTPGQVEFDEEAYTAVYDQTLALTRLFSDVLPLVDHGTANLKIARLAVALAVRTFSTTKDPEVVRVRKCHVDWVAEFIVQLYSDSVFGYLDFTRSQTKFARMGNPKEVTRQILGSKHPGDLVEGLLYADTIQVEDIRAWCDVEFGDAESVLSFLIRKRAIFRKGRDYLKSPDFIDLLKSIQLDAPKEAVTTEGEEF